MRHTLQRYHHCFNHLRALLDDISAKALSFLGPASALSDQSFTISSSANVCAEAVRNGLGVPHGGWGIQDAHTGKRPQGACIRATGHCSGCHACSSPGPGLLQ